MIVIYVRQEDNIMCPDDEHKDLIEYLEKYLNDRVDLLENIALSEIEKLHRRQALLKKLPSDVVEYLEEAVSEKDRRSKPIPLGYENIPAIKVYKKPKRQRKSNGPNCKRAEASKTSKQLPSRAVYPKSA